MTFEKPWIFPVPKQLACGEGRFLKHSGMAVVRNQTDTALPPEGYVIDIGRDGIQVRHRCPAGAFYAGVTLRQLRRQYDGMLPFVHIEDAPDYPKRGVLLDIGRNKIPAMESLFRLIDILSDLKINQLHLYMEGYCFEYTAYREHFPEETPVTAEEYRRLDAYALSRFIELVPTQNCFGHMAPWLALPSFKALAENPEGFELFPGFKSPPSTLNPLDANSLELVTGLLNELLPNFTSPHANICFDEPFELGTGKSAEACSQTGAGAVYLEFLQKVCAVVAGHGKRPMVWGDIVTKYPELPGLLPKDITVLDWNYEGSVSFESHCRLLSAHNLGYYVCPGTSGALSVAGRISNMKANVLNAAELGLKYGAKGFLVTDWGDLGHWQAPVIGYPGYVYGAAVAWGPGENRDADIARYLDTFIFGDEAGVMGKTSLELGDYSQYEGIYLPGATLTFGLLALIGLCSREAAEHAVKGYLSANSRGDTALPRDFLLNCDVRGLRGLLTQAGERIRQAQMTCADAPLVREEYLNTIRLLSHGADLIEYIQRDGRMTRREKADRLEKLTSSLDTFTDNFQRLWLMRNRPGGLSRSLQRFFQLREQYANALSHCAVE